MKGQSGTSMQGIEYAPKKKGNAHCNECVYLRIYGGKFPYYCNLKQKGRHWTSVCQCRKFKKKETARDSMWDKYNH